jgi:Arc/MetJ family transcription regulator
MRTNIEIDDALIEAVKKEAKVKTKKEAVQKALEEYILLAKQRKLLGMKGKVKWVGNLDEMRKNRF